MRSNQISELTCSIARAVGAVGDPWTLMVLRELFLGSRRFDDLQTQLGASPALLTSRLKALLAENIVSRRQYEAMPPRFEYHLTKKGVDLWPLMLSLKHWGDKWGDWSGLPPAKLVHNQCAHATELKLVCECCGEQLSPFNVKLVQGPRMQAERMARKVSKSTTDAERARKRRGESTDRFRKKAV